MAYVIAIFLADVYKERKFVYTGEKSQLLWEEYGIKVHFPPTHLPTHIDVTVSVLSPDDRYVIPEECDLVSALYDISADQQLPVAVTVEIEHCVPIENDSEVSTLGMTHIIARNTPPYVFSEINEGSFEPYSKMQLDHFTGLGTVVRSIKWGLGRAIPFYAALFYFRDSRANFVVTKNLQAHISVRKRIIHGIFYIILCKFSTVVYRLCERSIVMQWKKWEFPFGPIVIHLLWNSKYLMTLNGRLSHLSDPHMYVIICAYYISYWFKTS